MTNKKLIGKLLRESLNYVDLERKMECIATTLRAELSQKGQVYDDRWHELRECLRTAEGFLEDEGFTYNREEYFRMIDEFTQDIDVPERATSYQMGEKVTHKFPGLEEAGISIYRAEGSGMLYRGVSGRDWSRIQSAGYIDSDMRGAISQHEGINLAQTPGTAFYYFPPNDEGIVLVIDPSGLDLYILSDGYVRVFEPIPLDRVISTSPQFLTNQHGMPLIREPELIQNKYQEIENTLRRHNATLNCL